MRVISKGAGQPLNPEQADELRRELATAKREVRRQQSRAEEWHDAWAHLVDRLGDLLHDKAKPTRADVRRLLTTSVDAWDARGDDR